MAARIYRLGGAVLLFGLVVVFACVMLLAAALEGVVGGQASYWLLWVPRLGLLAVASLVLGLPPANEPCGAKSALTYLVGALLLTSGVMVADGVASHPTRVVSGIGLLLVAPSLCCAVVDGRRRPLRAGGFAALFGLLVWDIVRDGFPPSLFQVPSAVPLTFALLAVVLDLTEERAGTARDGVIRGWGYLAGLVLMFRWYTTEEHNDLGGIGYTLWLTLLLVPVGWLLIHVARHSRAWKRSDRVYVVGGLSVLLGFLLGGALASRMGWGPGGLSPFYAAQFWYPLTLALAMGSVCLGLMSRELRPESRVSIAHLAGTATLSVGAALTVLTAAMIEVWPSRLLTGFGLALIAPSYLGVIVRSTAGKTRVWAVVGSLVLALAAQVRC